jgi:hypothetical protein
MNSRADPQFPCVCNFAAVCGVFCHGFCDCLLQLYSDVGGEAL